MWFCYALQFALRLTACQQMLTHWVWVTAPQKCPVHSCMCTSSLAGCTYEWKQRNTRVHTHMQDGICPTHPASLSFTHSRHSEDCLTPYKITVRVWSLRFVKHTGAKLLFSNYTAPPSIPLSPALSFLVILLISVWLTPAPAFTWWSSVSAR